MIPLFPNPLRITGLSHTHILLGLGWMATKISAEGATGLQPCDALIGAGLGDRVLLPTSDRYEAQVDSWWDADCRLRPWCFFLPQTTEELSQGLLSVQDIGKGTGDWHIAVKSGGHSRPGTNNIKNGVTIDLSMINSSEYNAANNTARISTGARWKDVYRDLLETGNVTVGGGRDGGVGVGGYVLGGGITYYSSRFGFACDNVINYEVVLSNGSIINANANEHHDLFKALKGGGPNFGIVTHFEMQAMPAIDLAYGQHIVSLNRSVQIVDAIFDFANQGQGPQDDALITVFTHDTSIDTDGVVLFIRTNTEGDLNTTKFDSITEIPALKESWRLKSMADAANDSQEPGGNKGLGTTLTFLNDLMTLNQSVLAHQNLTVSLSAKIGAENFTVQTFFQPLSSHMTSVGQESGGNMLGLDPYSGTRMQWTCGVSVTNGDDSALAIARTELAAVTTQLKTFTEQAGMAVDLIYLNYAELTQDPLGSYGAKNVAFMKKVAEKYDPEEFFQRRVPGGFKLSRVGA